MRVQLAVPAERGFGADRAYGLIAQDVEAVLPELVRTGEDGSKALDCSKLPLPAIQPLGELKGRNDSLEQRVTTLESVIKSLHDR